jgi:GAF domain-containing protein
VTVEKMDSRDAIIASLRAERRAISDVLRAVARSKGLQPVLDEVVESATRLCDAEYGSLYLAEGDVFLGFSHFIASETRSIIGTTAAEQWEKHDKRPHAQDRTSLVGRVSLAREVVHIPDFLADPEFSFPLVGGSRAGLGVPILAEDELIGVMALVRSVQEPFGDEDIELVKTFADQAAIAIANARLIDAIERQLDQQQAISDVLGAVAQGEGLESVLHALVESACRLCDAQFGEVHLVEGEFLRLAVGHGGPPELYQFEREHPHPIGGDRRSVNGRVLLTQDVVHIPDILEDEEYSWSAATDAGIHVLLGAPLLLEGQLVGVFNIVRTDPRPFADGEIELLRTFADQAAIAVANARLMAAVGSQLEQQRAIADVLGVVARSEGLKRVFDAVVAATKELCDGQYAALYIAEGDSFHARAVAGTSDEQTGYEREHPHHAAGTTLVGRVARARDAVHIPDLHADPEYSWPLLLGHSAGLAVPILVEDELIGAVAVTRAPDPFTAEQIELVKTFADQAAIAIANARLIEAVERQRTEMSRFVSPQVAELVSSEDGEKMLAGHRAYVTCLFCDLRGFTSFTETAEPEELFEVLREYHAALGELIPRYEGTLEHFAGDGLMVFFNDPVSVEGHVLKAVELALSAQERFEELASFWRQRGHELGLGIGIASGYATLGRIGFEGRYDYGVLGTVTNLASRLSTHAEPAQTLISQRVYAAVEERVEAESAGELELKGFHQPVPAFRVMALKEPAAS